MNLENNLPTGETENVILIRRLTEVAKEFEIFIDTEAEYGHSYDEARRHVARFCKKNNLLEILREIDISLADRANKAFSEGDFQTIFCILNEVKLKLKR